MTALSEPKTWEEAARAASESMGLDWWATAAFVANAPMMYVVRIDEHLAQQQYGFLAREAVRGLRAYGRADFDVDRLVDMLAAKQHDYGHNNILRYGVGGVQVRISDKVCRLKNLLGRGKNANHEAVEDSFVDIVGYCVIAVMLQDDTFHLPLAADATVAQRKLAYDYNGHQTGVYAPEEMVEGGLVKTIWDFYFDGGALAESVVVNFPGGNQGIYRVVG